MSALVIALVVFVVVALATFAVASLFDERRAQARLIKDRLATVQKAAEREPDAELALLRDEQLSKIPAFDTLLRRSARVSAIQESLLQAGMKYRATLARAVRAGHAFTTALEMISNETSEPLASEFRQLFEEQKFGMPVRDALMNLTERVPLVDVKFFVTAVMLQRETGGNLAEILDNLSYVIRERFKIQRQARVHTAQGRLTMAVLMGMPPIVVAVLEIFSPEFVYPLFHDPIGHALLVVSLSLQTIGYFVIRKIIKIQV